MRAILICSNERFGVAALAEAAPIPILPILGKSLIEYWLEHLANLGAKEVLVLASDRPEQLRVAVGNGARWGLRITVKSEKRELTVEEARAEQDASGRTPWLPSPHDVILMDRLPGLPQLPLLTSYADWFAAARAMMPRAATPDRIGVREMKPGVWVGLHAHVASGVKLVEPCWIGDAAWIEAGAVIGPNAILEREVFIARGAEVFHSLIGPETFVGQFTEVRNSIAWGSTLINWERDWALRVPDEFLLCAREPQCNHRDPEKAPIPISGVLPGMVKLRQCVSQVLTAKFRESDPPQ